jgi:hypothetical protein
VSREQGAGSGEEKDETGNLKPESGKREAWSQRAKTETLKH